MYHQQFAFKCNIPPKKRVRILMTSKWLRSDPNPFTHPHLWPKSFKEVGACPQRKNQPTMITWDTNFSKPTTPPRKMVIDFFGGQQTTNWTKRVFKKKKHLLAGIHRPFVFGGGILYWKRNVAKKNAFVEILYFTLHTQTTYQRWRIVFGFRRSSRPCSFSPFFCRRSPQPANPTATGHPIFGLLSHLSSLTMSPSWTVMIHDFMQICHKFLKKSKIMLAKSQRFVFFSWHESLN